MKLWEASESNRCSAEGKAKCLGLQAVAWERVAHSLQVYIVVIMHSYTRLEQVVNVDCPNM